MRRKLLLSLFFAALLQVRPLVSAAVERCDQAPARAFVHRLTSPHKTGLGGHDAVSTATTNINGPFTITGTQGKPLPSTRLTTSGHVAGSWSASPNPVAPGLSLSSAGFITGTPTVAGTFTSEITAWEFLDSGPSASATFTFNITSGGTPPAVVTPPARQILPVGTNATLTVAATGTSPLAYRWSFAGTNLPAATNSTLELADIQLSQSGSYAVTITNTFGAVSTNATLTVEIPPVITNQPADQIVQAGSTASFTAGAAGTSLAWQWMLNSNSISGATNAILTLPNTTTNESGAISVVVSNAVGFASSSQARLLVVPPPGPAQAPVLQLAPSGLNQLLLGFATLPGYAYSVQSSAALTPASWTPLTNLPASFSGSNFSLSQSVTGASARFYRVVLPP